MDKKAVTEIKKCFRKTDCRIDRMRGCYVDENKEKINTLHDTFLALQDEEMSKYCELFKKSMTGRFGRNLFNAGFPLAEEQPGGHQAMLYALQQSALKDDTLVEDFFDRVIAAYNFPGKYLILLSHGVYDIPAKTKDGILLDDASDYAYSFILCSICPVTLLKEGLCYDAAARTFLSRSDDWGVQKPDTAFLFPAFNDRNTDLHELLYFTRDGVERHEELAAEVLGIELPRAEKEQQNVFRSVIEETLGRDCDFEAVKTISDSVNQLLKQGEDAETEVCLTKRDMRVLLEDSGASEDQMRKFEEVYDEAVGEDDAPIPAENVADTRNLVIKSDNLRLSVKAEVSEIVETRIIDGREYILIPVSDNLELNGIRIRNKSKDE